MATIQELLDLAYQIRDAEQNGENTALRVGQFLVELVNHFNTKADVDNISGACHLKQQQAPIMALMSVQQMSDSNGQDNKAWWSTDGHIKYQHNGRIYDLGTPAYMLYYCGDKIYKWTGSATGFKLMTDGGGGSSGGGASVFANFAVAASTNELPDNGVPTTGYIVGQNLYAYVGTGGDTKGGKYQNLGELNAAGVSLTTNGDGTFTVHSGGNDYTVNLNHTHPNIAKLIVCEESDLPSTLDPATIYVITDSGETEIEKLIIRGMEFTGGGVPDTGEPMISSPSNGSTINLGDNAAGQGVSKTITIKGKNLTGDLTVAVGTGLTISYGQSTGQSSVTIPMAQALLGAQVTIAYSGSGSLDDGSLVISHGGSVLSSVVVVVVVVVVVLEPLAGIKFTGSQWINTDYYPNPNTEFELELRLESNNLTEDSLAAAFLRAQRNGDTTDFYVGTGLKNQRLITVHPNLSSEGMVQVDFDLSDHAKLTFEKGTSNSIVTFTGTSSDSETGSLRNGTATTPLAICYHQKNQKVFSMFDLTIYEFTIKENGSAVRHYVPATLNGVAGLHETVSGTFLTSETSTPVVAIPISD